MTGEARTPVQQVGRQLAELGVEVGPDDPRSPHEILAHHQALRAAQIEDQEGERAYAEELARWGHLGGTAVGPEPLQTSPVPAVQDSNWAPVWMR